MIRSSILTVACAALVALAGCSKPADAGADAGAAAVAKRPKATLKLAEMKAAWTKQMDGTEQMKLPMDKKVGALLTTFGPPASERPNHKVWYALDGSGGCSQVDLDTKDGPMQDQTTDKANCGL